MSRTPTPGRTRPTLAVVGAAVLALVLGGCGGGTDGVTPVASPPPPATTTIAPPTIEPGQAVPAPAGAAVLTLTGRIAATNGGGSLSLDPATLDRLGLTKITVFDPWVKQTLDFQGVWLADLLKVAQADGTAGSLRVTALDNYRVDLPMDEVQLGSTFLATKAGDGAAIPVESGGPTRIVFAGPRASQVSPEQWIWSLTTIDVR